MANSKHAHFRYNILDFCFRKLALRKDQLLTYVNNRLEREYDGETIQLRQLDADLRLFRSKKGFNAPLPPNIRTYTYSDTNFSIAKRPLLEYEQYLVDATVKLLARFDDHPKYEKLSEALIKFQEEENTSKLLYYDHNEEYKGINLIKPLYHAIDKNQVLKVEYKNYSSDKIYSFNFHPQVLKQYNRRWFVFGFNETSKIYPWSIPLDDRFLSHNVNNDKVAVCSLMNWDSFFRSMVGVRTSSETYPKEPGRKEYIVLKFSDSRIGHFLSKPFHPDAEEFIEEEKRGQVFFNSIVNLELIQQILSYGQDVEVIEPLGLRSIITEHISNLLDKYNN
tara:strand:+ start:344133 stop:345137 length:1005 start_codon:yes stop_codon:yes gene_type:complete